MASRGRGAEPSPQLISTIPVPVVKSATVAPWLASTKVPSRTVPVSLPSIPVIELPVEPVSLASRTVTPPPGGLVSVVVTPPAVVMIDAERIRQARRRLLGIGVVADDLEDRLAVGGIDADLTDGEPDARDGWRAVAPAADGQGRR